MSSSSWFQMKLSRIKKVTNKSLRQRMLNIWRKEKIEQGRSFSMREKNLRDARKRLIDDLLGNGSKFDYFR